MGETRLKVMLLRYTPEPEELVAMAAKLCYSPSDVEGLKKKITKKDQRGFIQKLMDMGHLSPIEHSSFTFAIEGISRACSHQLVRHRLASYSQQSQRYVPVQRAGEDDTFDYIVPPSIASDKAIKKIFSDFMKEAHSAYALISERLNELGYEGESANQDARFVLPNASETKIIVTMNARELMHFFRQRCCNRAQWEIHAAADKMLELVQAVSPTIFSLAGPGCVSGLCAEGAMTCGKIAEVRSKYRISQ
ncbi:FAD-dependent thymidylate synthase [Candidatus Magnetominusculus xianensis]|uniref:Flavin-dependent thymidylate synthase n=1 Tax=Candidatus Magnetominusculus xianensis TaxID=1748249 RepID=A0ABR5SHN4_9BACT|nr:FAD-dependent thymidylate synthase [Candidatus Magnetominusculus xianensis]KWT91687.1 FAD-dependent thymidylate synthase [Candidatus Magnetominusculus xianensis]MBF0404558.1 FAD-dependent thymidylate synthase [Nitrospirota bacterium]